MLDVEGKFRPKKVSFDPKLTIWTMQQMSKEITFFLTLHDYKKYLFKPGQTLWKQRIDNISNLVRGSTDTVIGLCVVFMVCS